MLARLERPGSMFVALAVAGLCLLAGWHLFSSAVLLENACFLEGDRSCLEAVQRQVWIAFGLGGVFVAITGLVVASYVRRAWRTRRR